MQPSPAAAAFPLITLFLSFFGLLLVLQHFFHFLRIVRLLHSNDFVFTFKIRILNRRLERKNKKKKRKKKEKKEQKIKVRTKR
jgi:hypothetical protein